MDKRIAVSFTLTPEPSPTSERELNLIQRGVVIFFASPCFPVPLSFREVRARLVNMS
jgi:hypothetical protein